jgi:hypothetical protein
VSLPQRAKTKEKQRKKKAIKYVKTFNSIRNVIFINHLVTKTDHVELNKRHIHSNWNTAISAIMCSPRWIISCKASCLFYLEKWGNKISTLRIHFGQFENSSVMHYT